MPIFLGLGVVGLVLVIIAGALLVSGRGSSGPDASGAGASGAGGGAHAKSGTFTSAGSLPLDACAATLLADGRVLFTGEHSPSAELFDPKTGNFSPTGSMNTPRCRDTATVLKDGRVLFTGGYPASGGTVTSAELYDPNTGTFSPTGSMRMNRADDAAVLLPDGRVLVVGSAEDNSAELYDPKSGTFSTSRSSVPQSELWAASAMLLKDGRVVVVYVGGEVGLYDPATDTFGPVARSPSNGGFEAPVLLPDGRVLLIGGAGKDAQGNPQGCVASAQLYDPKTGTFSATGSMTATRCLHTAALLSDGRVLIAGGRSSDDGTTDLASAELYDPKTGTFSATGSMTATRSQHTAVLLRDGRVLIGLGWESADGATAELYQP
jgi:WD40 repeat protein